MLRPVVAFIIGGSSWIDGRGGTRTQAPPSLPPARSGCATAALIYVRESDTHRGRTSWGARNGRGSAGDGGALAVGLGMLVMVGLGLAADEPTTELGSGTYPAAYAIRGAKVVAAPGKVFEPGTIVVRRGVIEAVGLGQGRRDPVRRRDDRGQGAGRLSRVHRPVHDRRPARRGRAVGDRPGPSGRPGRGAPDRRRRPTTDGA